MCPDFPPVAVEDIWIYPDRQLTELKGTPREDILGEDTSFENGTGVRKIRIDRLSNMLAYEVVNETSVMMTGTEKILVLKENEKFSRLDGYIDLSPMEPGDTMVLREYIQIRDGAPYIGYANATYKGKQKAPLTHIVTKPSLYGIKVTAQQTAGANKTLDAQFYREIEE